MDVAKTFIAVISVWAFSVAPGFAAGQSGDWSSVGPVSTPSISASSNPNDRYGYPPTTQPTDNRRRSRSAPTNTNSTIQPISPATTSTSQPYGQPYQGWNNTPPQTIQPISSNATSNTQPPYGSTSSNSSQSSNPWVTTPAAPTTSSTTHSTVAPPPGWPTTSATSPSAPSWSDSTAPIAIADRSLLTTPSTAQTGNSWSTIGSSVAAPPLVTPQLPASNSQTSPSNTSGNGAPPFATGSYRDAPTIHSPLVSQPGQSTAPASNPSATTTDELFGPWNGGNTASSQATISRGEHSAAHVSARRQSEIEPFPPLPQMPQESAKATASNSNPWRNEPQSPPSGTNGGTNSSTATNGVPSAQSRTNSPILNSPAGGSTSNFNFPAQNSNAAQPSTDPNVAKPNLLVDRRSSAATTMGPDDRRRPFACRLIGGKPVPRLELPRRTSKIPIARAPHRRYVPPRENRRGIAQARDYQRRSASLRTSGELSVDRPPQSCQLALVNGHSVTKAECLEENRAIATN